MLVSSLLGRILTCLVRHVSIYGGVRDVQTWYFQAELADQQREQQREMEGILDGVRALRREIQLADLVLDSYIPKEYQVAFLN